MKNRNYLGEFQSWDDVFGGFSGECPQIEPRYVFAEYEVPGYEGYSTVIVPFLHYRHGARKVRDERGFD